jgi:hypothetical protein
MILKTASGNYNFKKDLKIGKKGEDYIIEFLENKGFKFIERNNDKSFDILMEWRGKKIKYEIKTDVYPKDTGNMVIEFESRGKESGISVTKSHYYIYYYAHYDEIWLIRTKDLKKLIKENKLRYVVGGDWKSNTKMWVIKKEEYRNWFKVYNFAN